MSINLNKDILSLNGDLTHRFATLWTITRTDGVVFRFTDHNTKITFEGNVFTPIGGWDASARQKQEGLKTRNLETRGIISSDVITDDDLRAGRYREAKIQEELVNWRTPWVGSFFKNTYWINETKFSNEMWVAQIAGPTRWLRQKVGEVYGRTCRFVLGDIRCAFDLPVMTLLAVTVSTIVTLLSLLVI